MTLPQATAIQVESRQPTTTEILAYAASRNDKWFSPPAVTRKREESTGSRMPARLVNLLHKPRLPSVAPTCQEAVAVLTPFWKRMETNFDAHVVDMRVAMGEISLSPVAFLRRRCTALGLDYDEVVGSRRNRPIIAARFALILAVKLEYPNLSLPQIGRIFGGRDHTTILSALRKMGVEHGAIRGATALRGDEIKALWVGGMGQALIAKQLGLTQSAVSRFIKRKGWQR